MVTATPWKVYGEWTEEVKQGPGQDNNIIEIKKYNNNLGGITNS